jgi:O-antigen ligase
MSAVAEPARGRADVRMPLLTAVFFLSPLVTCAAPRLTPLFVALVGFVLIGAALRREMDWRQLLPRTPALGACLLLAAYVLLNATWAADIEIGLAKAALLAGLVLVTFAAATAAGNLEPVVLRRAALAFVAGAFLGAAYLIAELWTHGVVIRAIMGWFPGLQPEHPKHVTITNGAITGMNISKLNQNINLVMFHLWPGVLALMALTPDRRRIAVPLFFVTLAAAIALSKHDSSQVGLVASGLVLLVAWIRPLPVVRALAALWFAAFVLVIPADFLAYRAGLHMAHWLPDSARARVIIWEYTAERVLEHPLLGVGVDSTPVLRDRDKAAAPAERPEGFVFQRATGQHAHDVFLQTWYELGAVGALLLALSGAAVALLMCTLPLAAQPFAAATFAAFAMVAAFAWGMWQGWFMCAIALVPLYLRVASASVDERAR